LDTDTEHYSTHYLYLVNGIKRKDTGAIKSKTAVFI